MDQYLNQLQNIAAQQNQFQNIYGGLGQSQQALQYPPVAQPKQVFPQPKEKKSMFKEITTDIKGFILEHRGVIYFIVFGLLLDHFIFKGAFKARLESMAEKVVTKVEEKIK